MMSCKYVTHLLSEAQDRPLTLGERVPLEMHLMIGKGCAIFRKQMDSLRTACRQHPAADAVSENKNPEPK